MSAHIAEEKKVMEEIPDVERADDDAVSVQKGDLLSLEHTDPVLNAKMHLINDVSASAMRAQSHSHVRRDLSGNKSLLGLSRF
jgi:hypothetical protein